MTSQIKHTLDRIQEKSVSQQLDGNCIVVSLRNVFIFSALNLRKISALTLKNNNFKS